MIADKIKSIAESLPAGVRLVAVSKFHPVEAVRDAYDAGQRVFGESHVQELVGKHDVLPDDVEWHFIGHLQTNKVKYIVPFVSLIHGIDSLKLLVAVNKEAEKINRIVPCLLQVHIATEDTKFGFSTAECRDLLASGVWKDLKFVHLCGLMGMATYTEDKVQIAGEFHTLKLLFDEIKQMYFPKDESFKELSMGMSSDYPLALKEGSTLVRVGTYIFGERDYGQS